MLPKIKALRKTLDKAGRKVEIEVDGGINAQTAKKAKAAGADILVSGSYIYNSSDVAGAIKSLR